MQVGLLVALALALRAKPAALLLTAGALAVGGRRYTSSGRLPLLLWLLEQAAQCVFSWQRTSIALY